MATKPVGAANGKPANTITALISRLSLGTHTLGWGDQAVVSATNFLLMILVGRWTAPGELGAYAIGISVLGILIAMQEAIIARPYSIHLHNSGGTREDHAFSAFALSIMLSVAAASAAGVTALLCSTFDADRTLINISWALAGAIPFVLMREFARRFAFANLVISRALLLNSAIAVLITLELAALASLGKLSAASALASIGIGCGFGSLGWLYLGRREFSWRLHLLRPTLRNSWQLGKWFLSSELAMQAQSYMTSWLALIIAGTAVTGIYAACASVVAFANPLLYGFFNILLPKFVRTLQQQGATALRRQACFDALLLAALMGTFSLAIFIFGDDILRLLYGGEAYAGFGQLLTILALASLAAAVGEPAAIGLAAAKRAHVTTVVTALTVALSLVLIAALLPTYKLLGAAYGMLAVEIVGSIGHWTAFLLFVPKDARATEECAAT